MKNPKNTSKNNHRDKGSAFFYILLGVALFGTLAFTVSRGMRGQQTQTMTKRQAEIAASDILDYAQKIAHTVNRLRQRNCSENDISFENPTTAGYVNPNAPGDKSCHVFDPAGGNISYHPQSAKFLDSTWSAEATYQEIRFDGRTCIESLACWSDSIDNEDLILTSRFLQKNICLEINKKLGITNPSGDAPVDGGCGSGNYNFVGTYSEDTAISDSGGFLSNQPIGCYKSDPGCAAVANSYNFYYALIER